MKVLKHTGPWSLTCCVVILAVMTACFPLPEVQSAEAVPSNPTSKAFEEWQLMEVESGQSVAFETLMNKLANQDVIYVGEEHRNRYHIEAALKILAALLAHERQPTLTIEMFSWDGQEGIDRYLSNKEMSRQGFLQESRWEENWGGDFKDYEPLIQFAREHGLRVLAMNPPRPLVRKVARQGLAQALADPEMGKWGMRDESIPDELAYRELIVQQIRDCHEGMPEEAYERFLEASTFRDEGMAKTIAAQLQTREDGRSPVVSYTGGGHIQRSIPVPGRVIRRSSQSIAQTTVYLASLESDHPEYIQHLLDEKIADYIWLTPVSEHGPPRRCG